MAKNEKKYNVDMKEIDTEKGFEIEEAVEILKKASACKFDETVELAASLNADPKKTDQIIRGTVSLPHGTGKELRIVAFCKEQDKKAAVEAGAVEAGSESLIKKVEGGWTDFDLAVATPEMMKDMGKLGKILGPRGLMPNPKASTLTNDIVNAIKEFKKGKIEFKMDSTGNIHTVVGKLSFEKDKLKENVATVIGILNHSKPSSLKKELIKKIVLTSTMGPGLKLNV